MFFTSLSKWLSHSAFFFFVANCVCSLVAAYVFIVNSPLFVSCQPPSLVLFSLMFYLYGHANRVDILTRLCCGIVFFLIKRFIIHGAMFMMAYKIKVWYMLGGNFQCVCSKGSFFLHFSTELVLIWQQHWNNVENWQTASTCLQSMVWTKEKNWETNPQKINLNHEQIFLRNQKNFFLSRNQI